MAKEYICKMRCETPWGEFKPGDTKEFEDEEYKGRIAALFDPVDGESPAKKKEESADVKVMRERLNEAKVTIPRKADEKKIRELFEATFGAQNQSEIAGMAK